ncbi:lipase 3-like [Periplaneta americana]|uniref:lipase 3-like n=1 Tax=Periplaneta americana TaxID=6978 RepID=UPI0037E8103A
MYASAWRIVFAVCGLCIASACGDEVDGQWMRSELKFPLPMPMLIIEHGYPAETHTVTTDDGYILTLHRIPFSPVSNNTKNKRPVVFIQHGLLSSSVDWIIMGPGKSLAYLLADAGYDVWLGNARGNVYSSSHVTLSPSSSKFWAFSWHEMGVYDLPAVLDYILESTEEKDLYYVGHSMGSTMFYVLMSTKPEYNDKIRHMVALAPVAYLRNTKSLFAAVTKYIPKGMLTELLYNRAFFPNTKYVNGPLRTLCKTGAITQGLCTNILFQIGGFDSNQINQTMLPILFTYFPAGSSVKAWTHYGQLMKSGMFRQYDYGFVRNLMNYGNTKPPEYNFAVITSSTSMLVGSNDWLATPEDAGILYRSLPNTPEYYTIPHPEFNHFDFLWAVDVKSLINDKILQILKNHTDVQNNLIIAY